jgi:hypothetical protein
MLSAAPAKQDADPELFHLQNLLSEG